MSENDEKKARLDAIRAANRAKAAAEGGAVPAAAPVADAPAAPVAAAPAAANMSDDKAARLAAIRAANAAKGGDAPTTAATTSLSAPAAAATAPRAAAPAAVAAKPVAKPALPPRKQIPRLYKVIGGAVFFVVVTGLLATTTHNYIPAIIFGAIFGAVCGLMFGSWPPGVGDEVTGGE